MNVFNPENIEEGDTVTLNDVHNMRIVDRREMKVVCVGGKNGNKVYCAEIGHELYANCFRLIKKAHKAANEVVLLSGAEMERIRSRTGRRLCWQHEATRRSNDVRLYTAVDYQHSLVGKWIAVMVYPTTGYVDLLHRVPSVRDLQSRKWLLTRDGELVVRLGRDEAKF